MQNTIKNALNSASLKFQNPLNRDNQVVYKIGMQLENGRVDTFVDIRLEDNQVIIQTIFPNNIPLHHRDRIANFITRANYGLIIGNFEMDYKDGELKYKSAYLYDDTYPNPEIIFMRNLFTSFNMVDKYVPGVMSVVYANISPENAINQIENVVNPKMN